METITLTHRIIKGKSIYNKRFDNYEKGFLGAKISKKEYYETRSRNDAFYPQIELGFLHIVEKVIVPN